MARSRSGGRYQCRDDEPSERRNRASRHHHCGSAVFGYLQPDRMGGAVDYSHRITKSLSAFGQGWAGVARDPFDRWQTDYGALGGVRFRCCWLT